MALSSQSLFLYGFTVTPTNCYISFSDTVGHDSSHLTATIPVGYYSLAGLLAAICRAMTTASGLATYSYSVDRTLSGNTENRVTISSSISHFNIYFASGNPSNPATLLGFLTSDYTGAQTYTGSASAGTSVIPTYIGYSFKSPNMMRKNFGQVNVSASGLKEAIVFALQQFMQIQFKYESASRIDDVWPDLIDWMIQQRAFEFTPEIGSPSIYYQVTLEEPNKGLELEMAEMLPSFPNKYQTPMLKFRVVPS